MTRGTFYLITNNHLYHSTEFNGDMYPDGHGRLAKELLERVQTVKQFYKMIDLFNELNHNYDEYPLVHVDDVKTLEKWTDFSNNYYDFWFSDWIFIKNISEKEWTFTYKDSTETATIAPNGLLIVTFGSRPDVPDLRELGLLEKIDD